VTQRSFSAPMICAISFGKKKSPRSIVASLLTDEAQSSLCIASGLSPVNARAPAPDMEADDIRYWVASSDVPNAGLDKDAFLTPAERRAFADQIVNFVNQ
jgi:hypothetical protein